MPNPFYPLNDETKGIILAMIETCESKNLGNFKFSYFSPGIDFSLSQHKFGWELTVKQNKKLSGIYFDLFDVYTVSGSKIKYDYSEKDIA